LAREYLAMAQAFLRPVRPCLVAIGGFSGTGKSTLALGLAPSVGAVPGAIVIRTDEIRKRLAGVSPLERLGPDGYSPEMSARVYATAAERARAALQEGHSAIVDAVFARAGDRESIDHVAAALSVPFAGIWLDAPEPALIVRVEKRRNDASDADANVIRMQRRQPTGTLTWSRIDASSSPANVLEQVRNYLQQQVGLRESTAPGPH
jgi:predicted kinase